MQKNPIPESGNNTDSQGWDLIIYKDTDIILRKSFTKHIFQKLEKSCLLSRCIFLCDILYSQNLRSIPHKDVHLCIFLTKTSFICKYITKAKSRQNKENSQ